MEHNLISTFIFRPSTYIYVYKTINVREKYSSRLLFEARLVANINKLCATGD